MKAILTIIGAVVLAAGVLYFVFGPQPSVRPNQEQGPSGIMGEVRLGPTCPAVKRAEPGSGECADKLYQGEFELTNSSGSTVVKTFSSDEKGQFKIAVEPGDYMIRNKPGRGLYPSCGKNGLIPVELNKYTEVIVFCDTGIR